MRIFHRVKIQFSIDDPVDIVRTYYFSNIDEVSVFTKLMEKMGHKIIGHGFEYMMTSGEAVKEIEETVYSIQKEHTDA